MPWFLTEASWRPCFAPDGGGGDGGGDGGDPPGGGGDWLAGVDDDVRAIADANGFKSAADALTAYGGASKLLGAPHDQVLRLPGKDAEAADWDPVYERLGRPKEVAGYQFPERDGADADQDRALAQLSHKLNHNQQQADDLRAAHYDAATARYNADTERLNAAMDKVDKALLSELGEEGLKQHQGFEKAGIKYLAGEKATAEQVEALEKLFEDGGLTGNLGIVKRLAELGQATSEDGALPGGGFTGADAESAKEQIAKLKADKDFQKKFLNASVPGHKEAVAQMQELQRQANPNGGVIVAVSD